MLAVIPSEFIKEWAPVLEQKKFKKDLEETCVTFATIVKFETLKEAYLLAKKGGCNDEVLQIIENTMYTTVPPDFICAGCFSGAYNTADGANGDPPPDWLYEEGTGYFLCADCRSRKALEGGARWVPGQWAEGRVQSRPLTQKRLVS